MTATCARYRAIQLLARALPLRLAYGVSDLVAGVLGRQQKAIRSAIVANQRQIAIAMGRRPTETELDAVAHRVYRNFGRYWIDFFRFRTMSLRRLPRIITVEGIEYLGRALALGRGVLALSAHYGSWEMSSVALSSLGYRMSAVVLPEEDPATNRLFRRQRRRLGLRPIPHGGAMRIVLSALARNEIVALLGDIELSQHMHFADFFGAGARLPSGPARLCVKTRAPIGPGFVRRRPGKTLLFRLHPPIVPDPESSLASIQKRIVAAMEREIREDPSQWYLFYEVWNPKASLAFSREQRVRF
jgi:KDO2-lipid IV(A) lauroyltransferase